MPDEASTFGKRLQEAVQASSLTQQTLASQAELSPSTLHDYMKRDAPPPNRRDTTENVRRLAETLGVRYEWLSSGHGEPRSRAVSDPPQNHSSTVKTKTVPHYGHVSAGVERSYEGLRRVEVSEERYAIDFDGRPPENIGYWTVHGDSAAPVWYEGEDVPVEFVDTWETDQIYVFRYLDDLLLKRLRRISESKVCAISLNPSIEDLEIDAQHESFDVIARVLQTTKQQLYTSLVGQING